ncbi:MAG: iron-sulfur cluster biosynthesis family protein [Maritimibacter sp.]
MFSIPGKQAVSITPTAAKEIAKLMTKGGHEGLRIGVKKGGCAGMEYTMDYVDSVDPDACGCGESIKFDESLSAEH